MWMIAGVLQCKSVGFVWGTMCRELCKSGWTDRDVNSRGPEETLDEGPHPTHEGAILRREKWPAHEMTGHVDILRATQQEGAGTVQMTTGCTRWVTVVLKLVNLTESYRRKHEGFLNTLNFKHTEYPLRDFYKNFRVSEQFHKQITILFWPDSLKGFQSYVILTLGCVFPNFLICQRPLYVGSEKSQRNAQIVWTSSITMATMVGSDFACWWARTKKFHVFLFVTYAFDRVCANC